MPIETSRSTETEVAPVPKSSSRLGTESFTEIALHTLAFLVAVLSVWLVSLLLTYILGPDAKLYDRVPIRYITDTGHLAILVRFVWQLTINTWRRET